MPDIHTWYVWGTVFMVGTATGFILGVALLNILRDSRLLDVPSDEELFGPGGEMLEAPDPERDLIVPVETCLNIETLRQLIADFERAKGYKPERVVIERAVDLEGIEVVYLDFSPA